MKNQQAVPHSIKSCIHTPPIEPKLYWPISITTEPQQIPKQKPRDIKEKQTNTKTITYFLMNLK